MNKTEFRENLKKILRTVVDNVDDTFIFPDEKLQSDFPYVTINFGDMVFDGVSNRVTQKATIIGLVRGDKDNVIEKQDALEAKLFKALYKNSIMKLNITGATNKNIFRSFGLDVGIFFPYAGVSIDIEVPMIKVIY